MSRGVKVIVSLAIILAVLAAGLTGFWLWTSRRAFPKTSGEVRISGLSQPVEILRDEFGVAHIYAAETGDLFFAEGYVHAQERFWQMEFQRRVGAGRLSEVFGETSLGTDRYLRHFGFHALAEQSYNQMEADAKRILDSYTAGVNAYIADRSPAELGLEFALLGLQGVTWEIEPWTPADSLIWGYMLMFDQSDQLSTELRNIDLLATAGQPAYAELRPPYRNDRPVIIPDGDLLLGVQSGEARQIQLGEEELAYLKSLSGRTRGRGMLPTGLADLGLGLAAGSNSFAISGSRTTTGAPLLANDPHMSVNMPALWYEIGMHCSEKTAACPYEFRGFSLPGVPGILIGHNDRLAWGLTNAAFDAEDVFIERLNPDNPDQYLVNGQWLDMDIRREAIRVRGWEQPVILKVRSTRNGLVATDGMIEEAPFSYGETGPELFALSYAWTALEPVRSVEAVLDVLKAQNWDEFNAALEFFEAGKQNWLYADVDGNIGYVLPGNVPIRVGGDGQLPVPGWTDDYIWTGFIPYDEMPRTFNPTQGFIVTANNPQVRAEDYPYLLNVNHDRGQRATNLTERILNDPDGISPEDMQAFQTDNRSLAALEIIPYLAELSFNDPVVSAARDRLLAWDGDMRMDSPEAALYAMFWVELLRLAFYDQLPEDLHPRGAHDSEDAVYFLLQDSRSPWWDQTSTADQVEGRSATLRSALERAYGQGVETFGGDLDDWRWGDLHTVTFRNATLGNSGIALVENLFNRGPFPTHGSESVPQKTCWSANNPDRLYLVTCIPALRQVVDLGDLTNGRMIHSVGQSGHPMHDQYDHFIEPWRQLEYHPSNWARADVEAGPHDLLLLTPQ